MLKKFYNKGTVIGYSKIIELDNKSDKKHTWYICECTLCNNIRSIRIDHLGSACRSCAAKIKNHKVLKDITGLTFGEWTVIKKSQNSNKPNRWLCKCSCGNIKEVFRGSLIDGSSKSCGHIKSWGEENIKRLLDKYDILYFQQYSFNDLLSPKNHKLYFDFMIMLEDGEIFCLIEFDGRLHFKYDKNWKLRYNEFLYLKECDQLKNTYCQNNNIRLIRFNDNTDLEKEIKILYSEITIDFEQKYSKLGDN